MFFLNSFLKTVKINIKNKFLALKKNRSKFLLKSKNKKFIKLFKNLKMIYFFSKNIL